MFQSKNTRVDYLARFRIVKVTFCLQSIEISKKTHRSLHSEEPYEMSDVISIRIFVSSHKEARNFLSIAFLIRKCSYGFNMLNRTKQNLLDRDYENPSAPKYTAGNN